MSQELPIVSATNYVNWKVAFETRAMGGQPQGFRFMKSKRLEAEHPLSGSSHYADRLAALLAVDPSAKDVSPDFTPGPGVFIFFDGTKSQRCTVPLRWVKHAVQVEKDFNKECAELTSLLLSTLSQPVRENLELDARWSGWVVEHRIDHLWETVNKYFTSHSTTMAGTMTMSIAMATDMIALVKERQGTESLAEFTAKFQRAVNSLENKGLPKANYDSYFGHCFVILVNHAEYSQYLLQAQHEGKIKPDMSLAEAIEMARKWEEVVKLTRHVIVDGSGAKGGSTTANAATASAPDSGKEAKQVIAALTNTIKQLRERKGSGKAHGGGGATGGGGGGGNSSKSTKPKGKEKKKHCSFCQEEGHWLTECLRLSPEARADAEEARKKKLGTSKKN